MNIAYWQQQAAANASNQVIDCQYALLCERLASARFGGDLAQADSALGNIIEEHLDDGTTLEYECGSENAQNGIFVPALVHMPCLQRTDVLAAQAELRQAGIKVD